jgi:hypothetical protein
LITRLELPNGQRKAVLPGIRRELAVDAAAVCREDKCGQVGNGEGGSRSRSRRNGLGWNHFYKLRLLSTSKFSVVYFNNYCRQALKVEIINAAPIATLLPYSTQRITRGLRHRLLLRQLIATRISEMSGTAFVKDVTCRNRRRKIIVENHIVTCARMFDPLGTTEIR